MPTFLASSSSRISPREVWRRHPSSRPESAPGVADVWHFSLAASAAQVAEDASLLSTDEIERRDRFVFPEVARRFCVARASLRRLLGAYLDHDAATLVFNYLTHGKPVLAAPTGHSSLHFNMSHSGDAALIAISSDAPVGVDIEQEERALNATGLADRYFTTSEPAWLRTRAPTEIHRSFLALWTRKEAVIKALGSGLTRSLGSFNVCSEEGPLARPVGERGDWPESAWTLASLVPRAGELGALAVMAPGARLRLLRLR